MAVMYLLACLYIIFTNFSFIDDAFSLIFTEAFNPKAIGVGGVIGVLLVGFKRAAFSNEAGAGSIYSPFSGEDEIFGIRGISCLTRAIY